MVTRAAAQQPPLTEALIARGATVVGFPTIAIAPPPDGGAALTEAVGRLGEYRWVVLTSTNGARALLEALPAAPAATGLKIAAVGESTAAVMAEAGFGVDLVPDEFVGEALLDAFPPAPLDGSRRVLLVRAAIARDVVPDGLRQAGWQPDVVGAYRMVRAEVNEAALGAVAGADVVLFASPSSVRRFVEMTGGPAQFPALVAIAIGAVTEGAAKAAGFEVVGVAQRSDVTGLVDAVVAWAMARRP